MEGEDSLAVWLKEQKQPWAHSPLTMKVMRPEATAYT